MASINVNGKNLENFINWSYTEDITGRDPSAHTGGTGQVSFSFNKQADSRLMLDKPLTLTTDQGVVQGTVRSFAASSNQSAQVAADDIMLQLKKYVVARAQVNRSLPQILTYLQGILQSGLTFSYTANLLGFVTTMSGFEGNFYDRFKEFLSAKGLAIQATSTGILITLVHAAPTQDSIVNVTENSVSHSLQDSCRKIEIGHYQHRPISNAQVYPLDYSNEGDSIQLEAGEIIEVVYDVDATLTSVNQPTCIWSDQIKGMGGAYDGTLGVYSVIGGDTGTDVSPSWWNSKGGLLEVTLNPDSTSVTVKVTAPYDDLYAPYTIIADPEMNWTGLYITGTGAYHKYEPVTITTGASAKSTNEDIGVVVDNIFVSNASEAFNAGFFTAANANMTTERTVSTDVNVVNEFGTHLRQQVEYDDAKYRVESVTHSSDGSVQMSLVSDTRVTDFDRVFTGLSAAQMSVQWSGLTALEVSLQPLKRI